MEAVLSARSLLYRSIRAFFDSKGYLEVETPLLSPFCIPESCLEVFETTFIYPGKTSRPLWLLPSPEYWMKGLIAETGRSLYQISRCFRNAESVGSIHNPEFSMLEWYAVEGDRLSNIAILEALVDELPLRDPRLVAPFRRMTMAEAFAELAEIDLDSCDDTAALLEECARRDVPFSLGDSWEAAFNRLFLNLVEPRLPQDRPLVLDEYPSGIDCLARLLPGGRYRARWELYAGGMELANCYEEERDPAAVSAYLEREAAIKATQAVPHAIDRGLPSLFSRMPPCSGVALGLDRLLAILLGRNDIASLMIGKVFS